MIRPLGPREIRIVPLGGLGEIGTNCLALEQEAGILVIDCGTCFPEDDLGIDLIHPDFSFLVDRAPRILGVFLTHGHEDHIGGLPYLLAELDLPVWGPPYALALARRRLLEHDFEPDELRLHPVLPGSVTRVGPFAVEPVRVSHSMVDSTALRVETCAGTVVHTGDYNFDPQPPDGEPTDEARLRAIGDAGVSLALGDSTNVDIPRRDGNELQVGARLEELILGAPARVFVSMFASNVHRLRMLGETAIRAGRKVALLGLSMNTHLEVAHQVGRLHWPSHLLVSPEQARQLPRHEVLVLAGGSQAERGSALARLAVDSHGQMAVEADDTVILSSRIVPGNEREVLTMMSDLLRKGATVHSSVTDPAVHTSGHAVREEQVRMLNLLRPRAFVPAHGTLHHLVRHAELARSCGIDVVATVENGHPLRFDGERLTTESPVPHGKVAIAVGGEPLDRDTLLRRAELGRSGVVTVALAVDRSGRVLVEPAVASYGVPNVDGDGVALRQVTRQAALALAGARAAADAPATQEAIRRAVRKGVFDLSGCRPVVQVQIGVAESGDDP